ncbi:hypothetical protein LCGC14_2989840, partial [marine sediment metagenome]
ATRLIRTQAGEELRLLDERNKALTELFSQSPRMSTRWKEFAEAERAALVNKWAERVVALEGDDVGGAWARQIRQSHVKDSTLLEKTYKDLGFDFRDARVVQEYPTAGAGFTAQASEVQNLLKFIKSELPNRFRQTNRFTTDQAATARTYLNGPLREALQDKQLVMNIAGRHGRDFVALNYNRKYGMDGLMSLIFPYHFWMGRTINHWARMSLARPGATAAYAGLYRMIGEINEDAGLPDRLKNAISIPIPFLNEAIGGIDPRLADVKGAVMFDPLRVMFPLAGFQNDTNFDRGVEKSPLGRALGFAEQFSGSNPFITGPLAATGALGDRDAFLRRPAAVPSMGLPFLPGPRITRAVFDYFGGIKEDS